LYSALYINELLQRLLFKEDPHPELYDVYCQSLRELQTLQQQDMAVVEVVLRRFEWYLLADLGYEITLERDSDYRPIDPDLNYRYDADAGFQAVPRKVDPAYQQSCFNGSALLAMAEQHWDQPGVRAAAKRLMRLALAPHLGEKPLKSRELFRQLPGHTKPARHSSELSSENKET
jgi:DNA repair protein RecO (recombination protein O)